MEKGKGYYANEEKGRTHITYQWRCTPEEKEKLMIQAVREGRTANKVLSDALEMYLSSLT